jgi:hypothetical protein
MRGRPCQRRVSADGSVLRTGLSHVCAEPRRLSARWAPAPSAPPCFFGDDEAGGPRIELALYSEQNGPPPPLKNRPRPEALEAHTNEPSPISASNTKNSPTPRGDGEGGPVTMTVTEISSNPSTPPCRACPRPDRRLLRTHRRWRPAEDRPRRPHARRRPMPAPSPPPAGHAARSPSSSAASA